MNQHEIVLYKMEDANVCVSVYYENETFWLTTKAMAELFGVKTQAITKHLGNIYEEEELIREATCSKKEQVQIEGVREVRRIVDYVERRSRWKNPEARCDDSQELPERKGAVAA